VNPKSADYAKIVGRVDMPSPGDELHHFGWNACSAALCPTMPHPHLERRYLLVPGLRSSRLHIVDIKPDPRNPQIVKTIEPETLQKMSGYSRPHQIRLQGGDSSSDSFCYPSEGADGKDKSR
jgi:selenium-binding protein 1